MDELDLGGEVSVGEGLEDLNPDVFMSFVGNSNVNAVDHTSDNLLGEADDFEGVVFVTSLLLNVVSASHEEFEKFGVGLFGL